MSIYKKIKAFLLAGSMFAAGISGVYSADAQSSAYTNKIWTFQNATYYDANDFEIFSGRTMQEIADKYSDAFYVNSAYDNENYLTWYDELPSTVYPYNPGKISNAAYSEMIAMTNFYRWLVGCDTINAVSYNEDELPLQTGALIRNFSWQHIVIDSNKPADMSDEMWAKGAGCDHNILAQDYTPLGAITAWMSEGYDYEIETWKSVGHRAIMMNYKLTAMAYGYCDRIAIGKANTSRKSIDLPFMAYPSPGYMPSNVVNPMNCAWSVQLNDDMFEFDDIEDVEVSITNTRTGKVWTRNYDDETMLYSFGLIAFTQPGDFEDNITSIKYTDSYQVEITGIHDIKNDTSAVLTYKVDFFDMNDYVRTHVSSVNTCRQYMIGPDMMDEENLRRIAAILPKEIEIVADNKQEFVVPIKGEWRLDMTNSRFVSSGDLSNSPSRLSDPKGLLNEIVIPYAEKTDICALYDTLDIIPQTVNAGSRVSLSVYRTNLSSDTVHIFKLKKNQDGSFTAERVFDSNDVELPYGEVAEGFNIEGASGDDSGEYLSVYFDQEWISGRYTTPVMVSNSVSLLNVICSKYDVNGDGTEDMSDIISLNNIICGIEECRISGDVNEDGRVNIFDLSAIREYIDSLK